MSHECICTTVFNYSWIGVLEKFRGDSDILKIIPSALSNPPQTTDKSPA